MKDFEWQETGCMECGSRWFAMSRPDSPSCPKCNSGTDSHELTISAKWLNTTARQFPDLGVRTVRARLALEQSSSGKH